MHNFDHYYPSQRGDVYMPANFPGSEMRPDFTMKVNNSTGAVVVIIYG